MKSPKKECNTCYGYGLWAMGDPSPMGPIDASDGLPTIACPECRANANPAKTEHKLNEESLFPDDPATDAHNEEIATMLELVTRNQELKERVRELEKMLTVAKEAIESLDAEALGRVPDHPDYGYGWPIRDELLLNISKVLKGE